MRIHGTVWSSEHVDVTRMSGLSQQFTSSVAAESVEVVCTLRHQSEGHKRQLIKLSKARQIPDI